MLVERTRLKTGFSLVRPAIQPFSLVGKRHGISQRVTPSWSHEKMPFTINQSEWLEAYYRVLEREEKESIFGRGDKRVYLDEKSRSLSQKTKEKETTLPLRSVALNSLFSFMMIMSLVYISAVVVLYVFISKKKYKKKRRPRD